MTDSKIIQVRELGDGEFEVTRGGEVYRRSPAGPVPSDARVGERVSAAEICEWRELGAAVEQAA